MESDELMDQVCDELMKAFETKDKALLKEALTALVLDIMDQDKAQDEGVMS